MCSMRIRTRLIAGSRVDSGRVYQIALRSVQRYCGNEVVASCSSPGRDQCRRMLWVTRTVLAIESFDQCIEQATFADIRRPYERDLDCLTRNVPRVHLLFHFVEQSCRRCKSLAQLRWRDEFDVLVDEIETGLELSQQL